MALPISLQHHPKDVHRAIYSSLVSVSIWNSRKKQWTAGLQLQFLIFTKLLAWNRPATEEKIFHFLWGQWYITITNNQLWRSIFIKKDPIFISSPATHCLHSQMHEKNVSQGQHDSLCGTPSHFLPQKCPPCGPSKGLSHPPLDEAASPNHSLVDELPKKQNHNIEKKMVTFSTWLQKYCKLFKAGKGYSTRLLWKF